MENKPNGQGSEDDFLAPSEYTDFLIGGKTIRVRTLTLIDLERAETEIKALTPDHWIAYGRQILSIVAALKAPSEPNEPLRTFEEYRRVCTAGELIKLGSSLDELFRKSGMFSSGEEGAAIEAPGTGTLTPSPPNLPSEGSVTEIPASSSAE